MAEDVMVQVRDLVVAFGGLRAVDGVTLDVHRGEVTALIGPNGAGKSTLLGAISGFVRTTSGTVLLEGRDVGGLPPHRVARLGVSRSFQDLEILAALTAAENVVLGLPAMVRQGLGTVLLRPLRARRLRRSAVQEALDLLAAAGLAERADVLASELSYGEQKVLSLVRLLATDGGLLLVDEPGSGLPEADLHRVGEVLRQAVADGRTVVLVDHNMDLVMRYADRVVVLDHGRLIASGSPQEVAADPEVAAVYFSDRGAVPGRTA